ncbi:hypothetical protein LZC95_24640 [Pendulispora brunnea]|uniref:Tetratricopeptide repeat protein n=1 Tax=Pendulispora brunnea TaxID=2905690 RepID=A0ABZ2KN83_9BACT
MAEKIVICYRMSAAGARVYLPRARELMQRAEALGATLVSWAALSLAFAWDSDAIEEAIHLAITADEDTPPEEETWACGIAQGEMEPLATSSSGARRADLAWGEPLVIALALSRVARGGEVLLHASVRAALEGLLNTQEPRLTSEAGVEVLGVPLDMDNPWKRGKGGQVPPSRSMRAVLPLVIPPVTTPLPRSVREAEPEEIETGDAESLAARLTQLAKEALLGGDAQSLERWSAGLKATGERDSLANRMHAMARLSRGKVGDALRTLKQARRDADGAPPQKRCQAALALGVGLSFAGRYDDALLEGLDALARARESEDNEAVRACLAFLAKLFARVNRGNEAALFRDSVNVSRS